ncbi:MAG: hypothetical protein IJE27_01560, partial [Anaerotignum sp.]|nr:hypothetical protein [Anaerotignum sp.]
MARKKDASRNKNGKKTHQGLLFAIAILLTLLCISTGSYATQADVVQVGAVAEKRYVAERDAIDEVTTEKLRTAAADSVAPIYKYDSVVEEETRREVDEMFRELDRILAKLKEEESFYEKAMEAPWKLPVVLTETQLNDYGELSKNKRNLFAEDVIHAIDGVYETGVKADAMEAGRTAAEEIFSATAWGKSLKEMAAAVFDAALEPNMVLDTDAMEKARESKRAEVENVMIRKNQKIVDEGEIITQEIYDRLVSLNLIGGAEYSSTALPLLGSFLMVGIVFGALYLFFTWGKGIVVLKYNEVKMLFVVYVIMAILLRLMAKIQTFTLIPLGLFAMLVSMLIGRRVAIIMNSLFCIVGCLIFNGDVKFLMYTLLVGTMGALLIQKTDKRKYIMPVAGVMALISFVSMFSAGLFFESG